VSCHAHRAVRRGSRDGIAERLPLVFQGRSGRIPLIRPSAFAKATADKSDTLSPTGERDRERGKCHSRAPSPMARSHLAHDRDDATGNHPGDTAIAVNPKDQRYAHLIGKHAIRPLPAELAREEKLIPIIADDHIDPEFGTGVLR